MTHFLYSIAIKLYKLLFIFKFWLCFSEIINLKNAYIIISSSYCLTEGVTSFWFHFLNVGSVTVNKCYQIITVNLLAFIKWLDVKHFTVRKNIYFIWTRNNLLQFFIQDHNSNVLQTYTKLILKQDTHLEKYKIKGL